MNRIKVELLHYTPITILLKALEQPYMNENVNITLAERVITVLKHESVSEHVNMNFLISGVSRLELQEHMRHRLSSTTCRSTRFTLNKLIESIDDIGENFVIPSYVESDWQSKKDYDKFVGLLEDWYTKFIVISNHCREQLTAKNDYIKYLVPEGLRTQFVWSLNVRTLNNFLKLRLDKTAHFEIRYVAGLIRDSLKNTYIERILNNVR